MRRIFGRAEQSDRHAVQTTTRQKEAGRPAAECPSGSRCRAAGWKQADAAGHVGAGVAGAVYRHRTAKLADGVRPGEVFHVANLHIGVESRDGNGRGLPQPSIAGETEYGDGGLSAECRGKERLSSVSVPATKACVRGAPVRISYPSAGITAGRATNPEQLVGIAFGCIGAQAGKADDDRNRALQTPSAC